MTQSTLSTPTRLLKFLEVRNGWVSHIHTEDHRPPQSSCKIALAPHWCKGNLGEAYDMGILSISPHTWP
jgi:hypothetical protein